MEKNNKFKSGILYCIQNKECWRDLKKCGLTTKSIEERLSGLHTSLPIDCEILCTSDELLDVGFYEKLLHEFLSGFRYRSDREFFSITDEDVKEIFNFINLMNKMYNNFELLEDFIKIKNKDYYKQRFNSKKCSAECGYIQSKKNKYKKTTLSVDTSSVKIRDLLE
jgi:hypothetical protein